MHYQYWAWIFFPHIIINYQLSLALGLYTISVCLFFLLKLWKFVCILKLSMMLMSPKHLYVIVTQVRIQWYYILYAWLLSYFMSIVSNQQFFFLLSLPMCQLLFICLNFPCMSSGLRAKFGVCQILPFVLTKEMNWTDCYLKIKLQLGDIINSYVIMSGAQRQSP